MEGSRSGVERSLVDVDLLVECRQLDVEVGVDLLVLILLCYPLKDVLDLPVAVVLILLIKVLVSALEESSHDF